MARRTLELAREGVPLNVIQRQLGQTNLGTTRIYLQGIDPEEIITAVRARRAPARYLTNAVVVCLAPSGAAASTYGSCDADGGPAVTAASIHRRGKRSLAAGDDW